MVEPLKDAAQQGHVLLVFAAGECVWNMTVLKNKSVFHFITEYIHEKSKKAYQKKAAGNQRERNAPEMPDPLPVRIRGML